MPTDQVFAYRNSQSYWKNANKSDIYERNIRDEND